MSPRCLYRLSACFIAVVPAVLHAQSVAGEKPVTPSATTISGARRYSLGGQFRIRAESYDNGGFNPANDDQYVLTRVLLHARVQPASALGLFVEGMDARGQWKNAAPQGAPFRDHADLRQLYLDLGKDSSRLLRAGRLELAFGDGRLVGSLPWANTARTFDGARGTVAGRSYRVDLFAASVVKVDQEKFDRNVPGNNFYGVYTVLTRLAPRLALEPFVFWRRQSGLVTEAGAPGTMNYGTYGVRASGKLRRYFDYDTQLALQRGSLGDESIAAWAGHAQAGYTAPMMLSPRIFAEYNEASGDENPTDNRKGTFDQLYPTAHDKYGLTDLVGWQNMRHVRAGLDVKPAKTFSTTVRYSKYWLADVHDALYSGGGAALARSPTGVAGRYVGDELDVIASAKLLAGLGFSGGIGYFRPGTFLKSTTPGKPYTYPYAMLTYDF